MDLKRIATAVVATTLFASSTVAFGQSSNGKKALEKMTCEDFVGLVDSFKPDAVYWAIAYGEDGKPESAGVSVEGIEQIVRRTAAVGLRDRWGFHGRCVR